MTAPEKTLQLYTVDDVLVISLPSARLATFDAIAWFERELRRHCCARTETRWLIDFGQARFFIPLTVNALLAVHRSLRDRGGRLLLTGLGPDGQYVLRLMGLDSVLSVVADVETGLAQLGGADRKGPEQIADVG